MDRIIEEACTCCNVRQEDVYGKSRKADIVEVRQLSMYLAQKYTTLTNRCTRNIHNGVIDISSKYLALFRAPVIDIRAAPRGVFQPCCVGMNRHIQHILLDGTHHGISLIDTGIHTVAAGQHSFYMRT